MKISTWWRKFMKFCNDFDRNAIIFGVDNSWSSHTDNRKSKDQLMISMTAAVQHKKIVFTLVKQI